MNIRFVSTLTADDENALAPAIVAAVGTFLDSFSMPYTVRIETAGAQVFQHSHPACGQPPAPVIPRLTAS
jgi:hypothetical protein